MGMFDSVIAKCPKCGDEIEFQSKSGDRSLRRYNINSVPPEIARDIDGEVQSCSCGHLVKIKVSEPISRVRMTVDDGQEWD